MKLTWDDTEEIAKALSKKYPDIPPVVLSTGQIRRMVIFLKGFRGWWWPNEIYLDAIQRSWIMLWHQ